MTNSKFALLGLFWNAFDGFITKSRFQSTQSGKLIKIFWWEKKQNSGLNSTICLFFFKMSFDTQAFKVLIFASLNFKLKKMNIISRYSNQILLTITGSIGHSSRCKLNVYVIAHTNCFTKENKNKQTKTKQSNKQTKNENEITVLFCACK